MIHPSVKIGQYTIIEEGVSIGEGTVIGDFVKLKSGTIIGENCVIDDYVNTSGLCGIGNNVVIKRCSMIGQATMIEDNVFVGSGVTTTRYRWPGQEEQWVRIKRCAFIGSKALIQSGVTVGAACMVGAGAVVVKDCDPDCTYVGVPARRIS